MSVVSPEWDTLLVLIIVIVIVPHGCAAHCLDKHHGQPARQAYMCLKAQCSK